MGLGFERRGPREYPHFAMFRLGLLLQLLLPRPRGVLLRRRLLLVKIMTVMLRLFRAREFPILLSGRA